MSTIDIVSPLYNKEDIVAETIESVQNQTYEDWRLIIIDDGSTDGSGDIADYYAAKDHRIEVCHIEHAGLAKGRRKGLELANSAWICFLDADDILDPHFFEVMISAADSGVDIVQCKSQRFAVLDEINNVQHDSSESMKYNHTDRTGIEAMIIAADNSQNYETEMVWSKIIRADLFNTDEIVAWLEEGEKLYPYSYVEDFCIIPRLLNVSRRVRFLDYMGYYYRQVANGYSKKVNVDHTHYEKANLFGDLVKWAFENGHADFVDSHIYNYFNAMLSYWYRGRLYAPKSEDFTGYTGDLEKFYQDNYVYVKSKKIRQSSDLINHLLISLWKTSHSLWYVLAGTLYFEPKYHYRAQLKAAMKK